MPHAITKEEIQTDPKIKKFFQEKKPNLEESTKTGYINTLYDFCNYTQKTPTELYEAHKKDLDERAPEYDMWLSNALDGYVENITQRNFSRDTIGIYLSRIKSFYKAYRLKPLPEVDINKKRVMEDAKHTLKVEDIQKAVTYSKPTYKSLFITQAQTGLSVGDATLLDVEDFILTVKYSEESPLYWPKEEEINFTRHDLKEAINKVKKDNTLIGCFDLNRKKTNQEFYTFAGPECLRSIALLLENRDNTLECKDPIFLKDPARIKNKDDLEDEDLRLNTTTVVSYIKRMHDDRKLFPKIVVDKKIRNYFRTHKIRAWFAHQCMFKAKLGKDDTKYLMGQKTGDVIERYADPNDYLDLKNKYRKALPHLAINDPVEVKDNYEIIEKLTKENKELQSKSEVQEKMNEKHQADMEWMKNHVMERDQTIADVLEKVESSAWVMDAVKKSSEVRRALKNAVDDGLVKPS